MTASTAFEFAEIAYRQQRIRSAMRHLPRRRRRTDLYVVVHPAGDARA